MEIRTQGEQNVYSGKVSTVISADKNAEKLCQQTDAKIQTLVETAQTQAVAAATETLKQSIEQVNESNETQKASSNEKEQTQESKRDSAALSKEALHSDLKIEEAELKLLLFQLEEAWKLLLNWKPNPFLSFQDNLMQLQGIYNYLKSMILQYTGGSEQAIQLANLEYYFFQALNRLFDTSMEELFAFFDRYAQSGTVKTAKDSVYQFVTGKNPPKEFQWNNLGENKVEQYQKTAEKRILNHGMIYNHKGKNNASAQRGKEIVQTQNDAKKVTYEKLNQKEIIFTLEDIKKAEKFVNYINTYTKNEKISPEDETIGLFTGVLSLKAQVFARFIGVSMPMAVTIKSAVDQFIFFYYIHSNGKEGECHCHCHDKTIGDANQKTALRIYQYITQLFQKTSNPKDAITKGIAFALELYQTKEENKEDGSFFHQTHKGEGKNFYDQTAFYPYMKGLKENWNQFIHQMGFQNSEALKLQHELDKYSMWGAVAKPQREEPAKRTMQSVSAAAFWSVVLIFAVIGGIILLSSVSMGLFYFSIGGAMFYFLFFIIKKFQS